MRDLVRVTGKVVRSGGRTVVKVARDYGWSGVILGIDAQLA